MWKCEKRKVCAESTSDEANQRKEDSLLLWFEVRKKPSLFQGTIDLDELPWLLHQVGIEVMSCPPEQVIGDYADLLPTDCRIINAIRHSKKGVGRIA